LSQGLNAPCGAVDLSENLWRARGLKPEVGMVGKIRP